MLWVVGRPLSASLHYKEAGAHRQRGSAGACSRLVRDWTGEGLVIPNQEQLANPGGEGMEGAAVTVGVLWLWKDDGAKKKTYCKVLVSGAVYSFVHDYYSAHVIAYSELQTVMFLIYEFVYIELIKLYVSPHAYFRVC